MANLKRLSDQTFTPSPPSKQAKQERSSPLLSTRRQERVSGHPPLRLSSTSREQLRDLVETDASGDRQLPQIYYALGGLLTGEGFVERHVFLNNIRECQEGAGFLEVLRKATNEGASEDDLQALVAHRVLWEDLSSSSSEQPKGPISTDERTTTEKSQGQAIVHSWTADFVGQLSLKALDKHVSNEMKKGEVYARYCSIVQSSGMGKSRLLDEFSKEHFLIPINLRPEGSGGFPPADDEVRDFLLTAQNERGDPDAHVKSYFRACHFLKALFHFTATTVTTIPASGKAGDTFSKENYPQIFRRYMSQGQTMASSGEDRSSFYRTVINTAKENMSSGNFSNDDLRDAFEELRKKLLNGQKSSRTMPYPEVFLAFDEAHPLTKRFSDVNGQSDFAELRRALRILSDLLLFTFFLSTTGKISQFTPRPGDDSSTRLNDGEVKAPPPFIYLGFDQLMGSRKVFDKYKTLADVTSLDCIAHMGRPLWGTTYDYGNHEVRCGLIWFAIQKLLCQPIPPVLSDAQHYAVLSQRLALDINSTTYIPLPEKHMEAEHYQISNHMRVCVLIGDGSETMRGIAASEPILSEAAARVMQDHGVFDLAQALSKVLTGFSINPGDRAELLVSAFFIWARDKAVLPKPRQYEEQLSRYFSVTELFSSLFSESTFASMSAAMPSLYCTNTIQQTFGQAFDQAWMHFNHFIKPQEHKLLSRSYLPAFMARGAAALGANGQPGFDAVYPYLYNSTNLCTKEVGFVIVQVKKNDVSRDSRAEIFKKMDPFACGLLRDSDQVDGKFPIPIIRIVFALCSSEEAVTRHTFLTASDGALLLDGVGQPRFTSYDFWCSGISETTLQPVKESPGMWKVLADKMDSWEKFYNNALIPNLLRSQFPAGSSNVAHFDSWCTSIP